MRKKTDWTTRSVLIGMPVLSFFGGVVTSSWQIAGSIATKPMLEQVDIGGKKYTDDRTDALKKYTDALAENVKQEAYSHSDKNRAEMQQLIIMQSGDIKAQGVKMDMVLDAVHELRTSSRHGK